MGKAKPKLPNEDGAKRRQLTHSFAFQAEHLGDGAGHGDSLTAVGGCRPEPACEQGGTLESSYRVGLDRRRTGCARQYPLAQSRSESAATPAACRARSSVCPFSALLRETCPRWSCP